MGSVNDTFTCVRSAKKHLDRVLDEGTSWPERKGHLDVATELLKSAGSSAMKTMLSSDAAAGILAKGQVELDEEIERREDEQRRTTALHEVRVEGNGVVATPADRSDHIHLFPPASLDEGGLYQPCSECGISVTEVAGDGGAAVTEEEPGRVLITVGAHRLRLFRQDGETDEGFATRIAAFTATLPECADGHDLAQLDNPRDGEQNECGRCGALFEWRGEQWQLLERTVGQLDADAAREQRGRNADAKATAHANMVASALQQVAKINPDHPERSTADIAVVAGLSTAETRAALKVLAEQDPRCDQVRRGVWAWREAKADAAPGIELEGAAIEAARTAAGVA